jgi:NitT/TauT family transport system substrate-binding protein
MAFAARLVAALSLATALLPASASFAADHVSVGRSSARAFVFSLLDVGIGQGIFAKHGIDAETIVFGGNRAHQAMIAGSLDLNLGSGTELVLHAKGGTTEAVAAMAGPPCSIGIAVRADDPTTADQIKGKQVGVTSLSSLTAGLARKYALQRGWGRDGINLVALGSPEAGVAGLMAKNIDALVTSTESGYALEAAGRAKTIVNFCGVQDFLTHAIFASEQIMRERPDVLRRFLAGWFETIAFAKTHKAETLALSRKVTGLSEPIAARVYDEQMPMFYTDGHFDPAVMDAMRHFYVDQGQIDHLPENKDLYTEAFLPNTR